jgi:hypothetical protein
MIFSVPIFALNRSFAFGDHYFSLRKRSSLVRERVDDEV